MEFTKKDLVQLSQKHQDALLRLEFAPILLDMIAVYAGDTGSTPERAVLRKWFEKKPEEFLKKLTNLEVEQNRKCAALARDNPVRKEKPTEQGCSVEKDEGSARGIEIAERFLKEWKDEAG
jgi:hypothetical protein